MDKDVAEVLDWMDRWASGEFMPVAKLQRMRETLDTARKTLDAARTDEAKAKDGS